MTEIENKPFRRHALAYEIIKELLMNADKPLSASDISANPKIAEIGLRITTVYDILESYRNKKLIRKIPAVGTGRGSRWAYEWVTVDKTITFQNPSYTFAEPPAEEPTVPEILVTATSVVIKTSKIKITVEY